MKVDWKVVAASPGYTSLKEAYKHDLFKKYRNKKQLLDKFNWVICRAKHYSYHTGMSLEDVLNMWENKRTYWWIGYYSNQNQPKLSSSLRPQGFRGAIKYYRNSRWISPKRRKYLICKVNSEFSKTKQKEPKRWTTEKKRRAARYSNV